MYDPAFLTLVVNAPELYSYSMRIAPFENKKSMEFFFLVKSTSVYFNFKKRQQYVRSEHFQIEISSHNIQNVLSIEC